MTRFVTWLLRGAGAWELTDTGDTLAWATARDAALLAARALARPVTLTRTGLGLRESRTILSGQE